MSNGTEGGDAEQIQRDPAAPLEKFLVMTPAELLERYRVGVERLDSRVFDLSSEDLDRAWGAAAGVGKWPIRVLLGHLADAEVSFVHRMRRVVAEPGSEMGVWDDQAFIDAGLYGVVSMEEGGAPTSPPIGAAVAVLHTLRQWTALWLAELSEDRWRYAGLHPERGPMTLRDLLAYATWHLEHHGYFCNMKVARLVELSG